MFVSDKNIAILAIGTLYKAKSLTNRLMGLLEESIAIHINYWYVVLISKTKIEIRAINLCFTLN